MQGASAAWAAWLLAFSVQLLLAQHLARAGSNAVSQTIFKPMFVLVGDSITEFGFDDGGWGTLMADTYRRKADIVNRGFGGYTSRMGVYVLDEFLNSFGAGRIKLVTLCFGANDASHPTGIGGYLHVPLEEYKANLIAMIKKLKSKGIYNIIMMTPPPTMEKVITRSDGSRATGPTYANVKQYAAAAVQVAQSQGVPYADIFNGVQKIKDWPTAALAADSRHLTPAGQKAVYDNLMYVINNSLKPISPSTLPNHMPVYRDVNTAAPSETFNQLYGYKVNTGVSLPPSATATTAAPTAQRQSQPAAPAQGAQAKQAIASGKPAAAPAAGSKPARPPAAAAPLTSDSAKPAAQRRPMNGGNGSGK